MVFIKNITEFKDLISKSNNKLIILKFFTQWCGSCKIMAPVYKNTEILFRERYPDLSSDVEFCEIDRDDNFDLIKEYDLGVFTIPRIIAFKIDNNNYIKLKKDLGGSQSADRIIESILKLI